MRKRVEFELHAKDEFDALPIEVQNDFVALIAELQELGQLREPDAKKVSKDLFELRVRVKGAWRGFYAYMQNDTIIIVRFFQKKTQKTPLKEIELATQRLNRLK